MGGEEEEGGEAGEMGEAEGREGEEVVIVLVEVVAIEEEEVGEGRVIEGGETMTGVEGELRQVIEGTATVTKGTERVVKEGERGVIGVAKVVIEVGEVETRPMEEKEEKEEKESILKREEQKAVGERKKQKKPRYRLRAWTQYYKLKTITQKSISFKNIHIFRLLLASHVPYLHTTRFQGEADKEIMAKLVRAVKTDLTNTRKVSLERKSRGSLSWSGGRWTPNRGGQTGAALVVVVVVG